MRNFLVKHLSSSFLVLALIIPVCLAIPASNKVDEKRERADKRDEELELVRRKEKCEAIPYKQEIIVDGCDKEIVDNHYCKGQCISGYVPENGVNGQYKCSSCQPHKTIRKLVTLNCKNNIKRIVDVEIFMGCKCMQTKCHVSDYNYKNFGIKSLVPSQQPIKITAQSKHPCRSICRKCRKAKREYSTLRKKKEQTEYLRSSCRLADCFERISKEIFGRSQLQRKLKKAVCKECRECKRRKRQKMNE